MSVIAFDFDGVMSSFKMQKFARKLMTEGNEIWIVTARSDNAFNRNKLKTILDNINLSENRVIFADDKPKIQYLSGINADLYVDNNSHEFYEINNYTKTIPVLYHE